MKEEEQFPQLFNGLGKLGLEYKIKLREGAEPFSLNTPHCIATPLIPAVREELNCMEKLGVISHVEVQMPAVEQSLAAGAYKYFQSWTPIWVFDKFSSHNVFHNTL